MHDTHATATMLNINFITQVTVGNSNECSDALVCVVTDSGEINVIGWFKRKGRSGYIS